MSEMKTNENKGLSPRATLAIIGFVLGILTVIIVVLVK
jgi:uncharacterized protein involved in exopolysaccharide biosynthesis